MVDPPRNRQQDSLVITHLLDTRPAATTDHAAEIRAMRALARGMLDRPESLLGKFAELAFELCRAGSAGVALLQPHPSGEEMFHWSALAGALAPHVGGWTPRRFSPCALCLERGEPVLLSDPARSFSYFDGLAMPIVEQLVLPLNGVEQEPLGAIWIVAHDEGRQFDRSDVETMQRLADFAAVGLEMARRAASQRRLTAELDHRVKNVLANVQAMMVTTLAAHPTVESFAEAMEGRLAALTRTHDLLAHGQWLRADLRELVETIVPGDRSELLVEEGERINLRPRAVHRLGAVFDELATNAAKYGALSAPGGKVRVSWRIVGEEGARELELSWEESGGPAVLPPTRRGVGSSIIEQSVPFELGGTAVQHFRPTGLVCELRLPLSAVIAAKD
jgi:two-component sensor histidine kinase